VSRMIVSHGNLIICFNFNFFN